MKTDRAKHNRLTKEKVNAKADLQRQINALDAQISDLQLNRPKNWEQSQKKRTLLLKKFAPHGRETTSLRQLDETSLKGNVKERNAIIIERNIIELDKKLYIIFAQLEQRQKEMDRTQTIYKLALDILPKGFSDELYHSFMSFEEPQHLMVFTDSIDDFATLPAYTKSQSVYDTMIKVFLNARSPSSQKGMQHHVVMNGCTQTVPGFSDGQNMEYAHTMHLQTEDQNS